MFAELGSSLDIPDDFNEVPDVSPSDYPGEGGYQDILSDEGESYDTELVPEEPAAEDSDDQIADDSYDTPDPGSSRAMGHTVSSHASSASGEADIVSVLSPRIISDHDVGPTEHPDDLSLMRQPEADHAKSSIAEPLDLNASKDPINYGEIPEQQPIKRALTPQPAMRHDNDEPAPPAIHETKSNIESNDIPGSSPLTGGGGDRDGGRVLPDFARGPGDGDDDRGHHDSRAERPDHASSADKPAISEGYDKPDRQGGKTHEQAARVDSLRRLCTVSGETAARLRPQLWSLAERVAAMTANPEQQRAIGKYAGMIDWYLFWQPGESTPRGVVLSDCEEHKPELSLDFREPWLNQGSYRIGGQLQKIGLGAIVETAFEELKSRSADIQTAISQIVIASPEYQLVAAFDKPQRKPDEAPLSPYKRAARISQIERTIRDQFGLRPDQPIMPNSPPGYELGRGIYHLDDETEARPLSVRSGRDAVLRAQAYFKPHVMRAFEESGEHRFDAFTYLVSDGGLYIRAKEAVEGNRHYQSYEFVNQAAKKISNSISSTPEEIRYFTALFLGWVIEDIMDPRTTANLGEILANQASQLAKDFFRDLENNITSVYDGVGSYKRDPMVVLLRQPWGEVVDRAQLDEALDQQKRAGYYDWHKQFQPKVDSLPLAQIESRRRNSLGYVRRYEPANFRISQRLLLFQQQQVMLPISAQQEDIVITLSLKGDHGSVPIILGYKPVSHDPDSGRWGFTVDPNGDPYTACLVPVPMGQRQSLAASYEQIGLLQLAEEIAAPTHLTVSELVELIWRQSDPIISKSGQQSKIIVKWDDWADLVHNGRLRVQCTGAARFLQQSHDLVFGRGSAGVVSGHAISGNNALISKIGHMQVVSPHHGRQYILDATPPRPYSWLHRGKRLAVARIPFVQQNSAHAPRLAYADHRPMNRGSQSEPSKPFSERVADMRRDLTERLKVAFDLPTDKALYDYVVHLPPHDPARQALTLFMRFTNGAITMEQRQEIIGNLERWSEADPALRQKYGVGHYSVDFLENLHDDATDLEALISENQARIVE